jgi:hypothetical protein
VLTSLLGGRPDQAAVPAAGGCLVAEPRTAADPGGCLVAGPRTAADPGGWKWGSCPFHSMAGAAGSCAARFARDGVVCTVRSRFWQA